MPRFARACVLLSFAATVTIANAARAEGFSPVTDQSRFVSILGDRVLRYPMFGIRLTVSPDGRIDGSALGLPVSGTWAWQDGYFCREMAWGGRDIPFNCQLVEASADGKLRFTVDKGAGDSATFRLE